jgi:small nuclear ribonucleoprotein (snRNP)-like protein
MKADVLAFLKSKLNRTIQITTTEQETLVAIVRVVDEEERYVILDLLSTNQPERYERMGRPVQATYLLPFEFIESVQELPRGLGS